MSDIYIGEEAYRIGIVEDYPLIVLAHDNFMTDRGQFTSQELQKRRNNRLR